jgi:segregation and condensation protein A
MDYRVTLEEYSGPLDALLALIEERKLEITSLSIAHVTEDFLLYLKNLTRAADSEVASSPGDIAPSGYETYREKLRLIADFIVIASRLVLIKSKAILPDAPFTSEEEHEMQELETRLKLYRDMKPAVKALGAAWKRPLHTYSRPYLAHAMLLAVSVEAQEKLFFPGASLKAEALSLSLSQVLRGLERHVIETQVMDAEKIVTIEEEMQDIIKKLERLEQTRFDDLSRNRTRAEVIVVFLALLHLARDQAIALHQENRFSDIIVGKRMPNIAETAP